MAAYNVSAKFREDIKDLPAAEAEAREPFNFRVSASDATRAISQVVNMLKSTGEIAAKSDVKVLEVKLVP